MVRHGPLLILAVALVAGAVLRLWQIDALGVNTDEAVYAGQAAAIDGNNALVPFFPVFRAHPLLAQFALALFCRAAPMVQLDLAGRLLAAVVGLGTIVLTYGAGRALFDRYAGALAALFLALMPYHVIVSRQFLLDGPMAFFATLTLLLLARFIQTGRASWLYATSAALGLTFLAKETGIVLLAAVYAVLALSPEVRLRGRDLGLSLLCFAGVILPFPLTLALGGGGGQQRAHQYLIWQLFRRPNHPWSFYLTDLPGTLGLLLLILALVGLFPRGSAGSRRWERLLLLWIAVPLLFFELWPVKGFQYPLAIAPPLALLAARALTAPWRALPVKTRSGGRRRGPVIRVALALAVAASLAWPSWSVVQAQAASSFLAGSGGVAGGREAGDWIRRHVPVGAEILTIGPSIANIIEFYGHRAAYGLSVSTNPLHRNPSYLPIANPDGRIRGGSIQYIAWDAYSAARSPFFAHHLLRYVRKYHGYVVHVESVRTGSVRVPVIVLYAVRP